MAKLSASSKAPQFSKGNDRLASDETKIETANPGKSNDDEHTKGTYKMPTNNTNDGKPGADKNNEGKGNEYNFVPMISASGRDYSERKGIARVIKKEVKASQRLPRYVSEKYQQSGQNEDVVMQEESEAEELQKDQPRRSKRLAKKSRAGN